MATFPSPSEIKQQYLQILKSIKPDLNINDPNSDFVIRGAALAGLLSGLFGDQQKVYNDTFVSTGRRNAVLLKGADLGMSPQAATPAKSSQVRFTGVNGTIVSPGQLTLLYVPTNVIYSNVNGGTVSGGILDLQVQCQITGQVGNIALPDTLKVVTPPSGINAVATLVTAMADGADEESLDSFRARVLSREQNPPAGGNETDYPAFAFAADPSVRSAFIKRFGRGLGTVDIYITTGTTDIDTAVTQGQPIIRIPSGPVLAIVQDYYDSHAPLTDCPMVFAPNEVDVDATVKVILAQGLTLSSVPSDPTYNPLGLTCLQLIQREISRVMYKLPVGGRILPGGTVGYVVASDLEEGLDVWLSAVKDPVTGLYIGKLPILADRQVQPLDSPNYNKQLAENELATPGTITVTVGV